MTLSEYLRRSNFSSQNELRRVLLLAFYYLRQRDTASFRVETVSEWLTALRYPKPNSSRLKEKLKKSKLFTTSKGEYRIHPSAVEALDTEFPEVLKISEETVSHDTIIQESLLQVKRGFVTSLIKQINASYENNIFDGCAVLMRRLLEILLILSYETLSAEVVIKDSSGNYKMLNLIINDALTNGTLSLSRNTKDNLNVFRKLGNFSAHKIYYNAKKKDIDQVILDYRATIEELMYKSDIRK